MNYCPENESRILEYDELCPAERVVLDAHLETCDGCRAFSSALAVVDVSLSAAVQRAFVEPRPVRPPLWPEFLDLAGWVAVLGTLVAVAIVLAPPHWEETALWSALGLTTTLGTAWFGFKSWRELSN